ncbi:MAG TPA: hypothetical protein DCG19_01035, partial [Cryomorphaceae bacterium]|nr:hypothetical protein [Cryomorphaceae bacterium]
MHITKILVTACLLFFGTTYAQVVKQTVQLNENSIDAVAFGQGTSRYILAAVKINPLLIAIGDFPVSFEYAPWDNFSVEAGIGITFRNYLRDESGIPDAEVDYNPGFSLLINIKSFRYEDALDNGDYFSLQYSRRLYNREIFIPGYPSVFKEKRIENDFSLIYGWQLFFIKDRLF